MQADAGTLGLILIFIICLGAVIALVRIRDKEIPEKPKYKKKNKKKRKPQLRLSHGFY
ncbi:hypothetical protein ES708_18087 [subsurface metagenome]